MEVGREEEPRQAYDRTGGVWLHWILNSNNAGNPHFKSPSHEETSGGCCRTKRCISSNTFLRIGLPDNQKVLTY